MSIFLFCLTLLLLFFLFYSVFREGFHPSFCDDLIIDCNNSNLKIDDCQHLEGCINNEGLKTDPDSTCRTFYDKNCG